MASVPVPQGISWDDDKPKQKKNEDQHYRAIEVQNQGLDGFRNIAAQSKGFGKQQIGQPISGLGGDGNKGAFSMKIPVQVIALIPDDAPKQKQSAPELIVAVDAEEKTKSPSKDEPEKRYTNNVSSYAVKEQSPAQVLSGLTAVLVNYSQDMDIKLDETNNTIEGVVFIQNYYGIKFVINIWSEDKETTRFELVRTSGDAVATAKFLGDIQTKFFIDIEDNTDDNDEDKEPEFSLVSLSLDATSLDLKQLFRQLSTDKLDGISEQKEDAESQISQEELDDVNESLQNNEQESVDELQFLHQKLKDNGAISKDIVGHEQLVKTIIAEAMKNKDICVVRGCLLILEQLCTEEKIGVLLVEQYALFENLATLLNHQYALIKNYSVRLLAKLSSQKKWNMNKDAADNIQKLVKQYQDEWKDSILANNGCINKEMFDSIYKKLSECQ